MQNLIQPWYTGVPAFLAQKARWIVWKAVKRTKEDGTEKIDKVPYCPLTGRKGGIDQRESWVTLEKAFQIYVLGGYSGVGYVFDADDGLFAIDLDKCLSPEGVTRFAETIVNTLNTYTEVSVSGTGLHVIGVGALPGKGRVDHSKGIECYNTGRYFAITGKVFGGHAQVEHRGDEVKQVYESCWGKDSTREVKADNLVLDDTAPLIDLDDLPVSKATLELIRSGDGIEMHDNDRSKALFHVCHELVVAGINKETILHILTDKTNYLSGAALDRRGGSIRSAKEWLWKYTLGVVVKKVEEDRKAFTEEVTEKVKQDIPFEKNNHERNANLVMKHVVPVVRVNERYLYYTGECWKPVSTEIIEGKVQKAMSGKGFPLSTINNTLTTLRRFSTREHFDRNQDIINLQNGAISLSGWDTNKIDLSLLLHDKKHNAIGITKYEYDPYADCPLFKKFLHETMCGDQESIDFLLQFLGYLLVPNLIRFQTILYLVGATGSGKSTFIKIAQALVGEENTVGTSFNDLAGDHGLTLLEDKQLVVIPDAHQVEKSKINRVKETLLNITTGDTVTINPKGRDAYSTVLPGRIIMAANEPPRFADEYGALMRRYKIIHFMKSFVGAEDVNLEDKLRKELPGIFNLAIKYLIKLGKQGRFVEPMRSQLKREEIHMVQQSLNYFSKTFVIHTKNDDDRVEKSVMYDCYLHFMNETSQKAVDSKRFGRRLKDEIQGIKEGRLLVAGGRAKAWIGVKINTEKLENFDV